MVQVINYGPVVFLIVYFVLGKGKTVAPGHRLLLRRAFAVAALDYLIL